MYSQSSCNFLPDKRQSPLSHSLSHSFGLIRNFNRSTTVTTRSFSNFKEVSEDSAGRFNNFTTKPPSIMSFVYTLGETSRFRPKTDVHSSANGKSRSHDCRDLFAHYTNMTALPFVSSHLVGGFVGSKSQLGRRPKQGLEVKMWDIIRDLLYLVGRPNPPNSVSKNLPVQHKLTVGKKSLDCSKVNNEQCFQIKTQSSPESLLENCNTTERKLKQSYADVARSKSGSNSKTFSSDTLKNKRENFGKNNSSKDSRSNSDLLEPKTMSKSNISSEEFNSSRDRITSECSADSEDSFIVFESCGEDHFNCNEDVNNWNDDEEEDDDSALSVDYEDLSHSDNTSSRTSCRTESIAFPVKKVRFPEGKSLAKVHPMVVWNYAYRSARRGPWEMLARDSERFRFRIAHTEKILKPVLNTEHRESVYRQRFAS